MRTTITIALALLLGGCATTEALQVLDNVVTYMNRAEK